MEGQKITAIGLGAPGPTDPYEGVVLVAPNLPGWHNVPLRQLLAQRFGVPVFIGNDANLAGLAEYRYGAGRKSSHMIYITVSTGIGGGVISGKRLLIGRQGLAAEIGHITIDYSGEQEGPARSRHARRAGLGAKLRPARAQGTACGCRQHPARMGKRRHRSRDAAAGATGGSAGRRLCVGPVCAQRALPGRGYHQPAAHLQPAARRDRRQRLDARPGVYGRHDVGHDP